MFIRIYNVCDPTLSVTVWACRDLAKYKTITLLIRSLGLVINKNKIKKFDISWLNPLRRDGHTYLARIQFSNIVVQ